MRILGIDHGTARFGIAVSDELKMIATPLEYIPADPFKGVIARLKEIIVKKEIEQIIVGMPRNMDGSYGPASEKVREFVAYLSDAVAVPVRTWDERLSTVSAQKSMISAGARRDKRREKVDSVAAAIILQGYLDAI
ncbi:Holliday junction resolvase RuvX [Verrucomicrobia bacterium]|nr:Holliday junction resolvase RuvX [Verrucomicrobiota bacterium]